MTGSGLRSPASNHCLASLDLGADAEQPFDCLIVQNRQAVQSISRSMDIGGQHGQRFVLLRHTHRPQRRPYSICTSRSGNVWHWCGGGWAWPTLFLTGLFQGGVGASVGDESMESRSGLQPLHIPSVICRERLTSAVVVRWTDELLYSGYKCVSRFEAPCIPTRWTGDRQARNQLSKLGRETKYTFKGARFLLYVLIKKFLGTTKFWGNCPRMPSVATGLVSAEWNRCPDSMSRRARDSVAPFTPVTAVGLSAAVPPKFFVPPKNFIVPKKNCFKHNINKILPKKTLFCLPKP